MTIRVAYRAFRSRRKFLKMPIVKARLGEVLDGEVKTELIKRFDMRQANWEKKSKFVGKKFISVKRIRVSIFPTGANKDIWKWVSGGTKGPYPIRPRGAKRLMFTWGGPGSYKAKTAPGGKFGGPGVVVGGSPVFSKGVMHPGIKAREFEKTIAEDYKREFSRVMENALRRIIRRL